MAILKVNGTDLPDPSTLSIAVMDIDAPSTTRNARGEMLRDRVRGAATSPRKLEAEWKGLKVEVASTILQAVSPVFFTLEYTDTYTGGRRSGTFYVGDRNASVYRMNEDGSGMVLESLKMNFIER